MKKYLLLTLIVVIACCAIVFHQYRGLTTIAIVIIEALADDASGIQALACVPCEGAVCDAGNASLMNYTLAIVKNQ